MDDYLLERQILDALYKQDTSLFLHNTGRQELCNALNNHWQDPSAVYDVRPYDDGKLVHYKL